MAVVPIPESAIKKLFWFFIISIVLIGFAYPWFTILGRLYSITGSKMIEGSKDKSPSAGNSYLKALYEFNPTIIVAELS